MTTPTRFGAALCVAVVFQLLLAALRAEEAPQVLVAGLGAPAQDAQGPQGAEIVALNIGVPKTSAAFETSAALLFLQPGAGNLMYGTLVNPFPFLSPHWSDQEVRPDFTPAFNVALHIPLTAAGASSWTGPI